MTKDDKKRKYRFVFRVKRTDPPVKDLKRRFYYDPNNPYQTMMNVLLQRMKKNKD